MNIKPTSTMVLQVRAFSPDENGLPDPQATPTRAEVIIYGDIGESWNGAESTTARHVVEQLGLLTDVTSIHVRINSYGGSVADGLAIYHALLSHPAQITVSIDSVAASVASLIAMAGDQVFVYPSSLMMIHAPWGTCIGNRQEMEAYIDDLDRWSIAMAKAYARKSGKAEAECLALLTDGEDHWLTAAEALAFGFADVLMSDEDDPVQSDSSFAAGLHRFVNRAPFPIAAHLRTLTDRGIAMNNASAAAVLTAERTRRADIRQRFNPFTGRDRADHEEINALLRSCEDDPDVSPDEAGRRLLALVARDVQPLGSALACEPRHSNPGQSFVAAATDAVLIRAGVRVEAPAHGARDLVNLGIHGLARASLHRAGREGGWGGRGDTVRAALSTSDFPLILENALGKMLRNGYENEPRTFEAWTSHVQVDDFREQKRPILGSAPDLLPVLEGGEYQYGSLDEDRSVPYAVGKFGRILRFTFEAMVNDDLAAFARLAGAMGQASARAEADQIYASFAENAGDGPNMQDSKALFHSDHNNIAASATALDAAALGAARVLLRRQVAVGGGVLNLVPRFLLVAPEFEQDAEILLSAASRGLNQGSNNSLVPAWLANLTLVVESRLTDAAAYLLAGPSQIDTVERAWLDGDNGPVMRQEECFATDDMSYKVRHVFGSRWLDWRGAVKLPISGPGQD